MKKLLLFSFCLFVGFFSNAANWHPFPFSISYYSRPVSFGTFSGLGVLPANGPLVSGNVVEGIYLDSAIQTTSNSVRSRSKKFPDGHSWNGYPFANKMRRTRITTNVDSSIVIWENRSEAELDDSLAFYPKEKRIGHNSQIQSKTYENVLGAMDSVISLTFQNRTFRWSKKFGIIRFEFPGTDQNDSITFIGSPAIAGSWNPFTEKPALPTAGDQFHYRLYNKSVELPNGPTCPNAGSSFLNQEIRTKVLEYPHLGNAAKMLIEKIVSDSGGTTGVLYSEIADTSAYYGLAGSPFVFRSPGTGNVTNSIIRKYGYFIDNNGLTTFFMTSPVFDGWPIILFFTCGISPIQFLYDEGTAYPGGMCTHEILNLPYPLYIKSQASCTMGTPLPPVTITSVSGLSGLRNMQISPNPATGSVRIQVPGMESESLSFELIHFNGKTSKGILNGNHSERTLNLSGFSSGLYILRISNGQETRTEKLVVE